MSSSVKAKPYTWKVNGVDTTPGAYLTAGTRRLFIPGDQLHKIADQLHDIAESQDQASRE